MIPLCILFLIAVAILRETWVEAVLPTHARAALNRGDKATEKALLERIITIPRLLPGRSRGNARYRLAALYMGEGQYAEAAEECRRMLAATPGRAAATNVRRRLADCLEAMGDTAGALRERYQVEKALESGRETADSCISRGDELRRVQRYADACIAYERALALIPNLMPQAQGQVMLKLAIAYFDAGQPAKTVEWAERSLQQRLEPKLTGLAHRMAGIGCSNMGWLDRAETHYRQGLEIATIVGNQEEIRKDRVQLAHVQQLRGRLTEALETCQQDAGVLTDGHDRVVQMVEYESLRQLGRFEEARLVLIRAQHSPSHSQPAAERRSQATIALGLAWIEADAGRPHEAWDYLQQATRVFMTDAKMNVSCEATLAWVLALLGRKEEAIRKAEEVEARMSQWMEARRTAQTCCSFPGRAYFVLGEWERSRDCWERYLSLSPDPVYGPMAFWYIGECSYHLGEVERTRESFRKAVSLNIPTYYASLSEKRLRKFETTMEFNVD